MQCCKATISELQIAADTCHIIYEGKLLHNFLFCLFLKTHDIGDFVYLVSNNIVSHDTDRKAYIENGLGRRTSHICKGDFIEMPNRSLFYSQGMAGVK